VLVVSQVALAVILVIGAGLLIKSFWKLLRVDPGFRTERVLSVSIELPASRYPQQRSDWPDWPQVRDGRSQPPLTSPQTARR
jgi:hypothetical protein